MDSKDKSDAEEKIKELKESLEGNDIEDIKKKTDSLNEVAMKLATKVYEQAAQANQNTGSEEETTSNDNKKRRCRRSKLRRKIIKIKF